MHPSCEYHKVRSSVDDSSSEFGIIMLASRARIPVEKGFQSADRGRYRRGMSGSADETMNIGSRGKDESDGGGWESRRITCIQ